MFKNWESLNGWDTVSRWSEMKLERWLGRVQIHASGYKTLEALGCKDLGPYLKSCEREPLAGFKEGDVT